MKQENLASAIKFKSFKLCFLDKSSNIGNIKSFTSLLGKIFVSKKNLDALLRDNNNLVKAALRETIAKIFKDASLNNLIEQHPYLILSFNSSDNKLKVKSASHLNAHELELIIRKQDENLKVLRTKNIFVSSSILL